MGFMDPPVSNSLRVTIRGNFLSRYYVVPQIARPTELAREWKNVLTWLWSEIHSEEDEANWDYLYLLSLGAYFISLQCDN